MNNYYALIILNSHLQTYTCFQSFYVLSFQGVLIINTQNIYIPERHFGKKNFWQQFPKLRIVGGCSISPLQGSLHEH